MWFDIFKGDDFEVLVNMVTGITSNISNNVIGIIFHAITPPLPKTVDQIILGRFNSGINSLKCENTVFSKEIGAINVPRYTGTYVDYMCDITIYLPYCGHFPLDPSLVVGKKISAKYIVDISTGSCSCELRAGKSLIYTFDGLEGCNVPFSMSNGEEYVRSVADLAGKLPMVSNPVGASLALATGMSMEQPSIQTSSINTSASISQVHPQKAFIIIKKVKQSNVGASFNKGKGRVLCRTEKLSELEGFTIVNNPRIDTIHKDEPAMMDGEYEMLVNCMREGVIL